MHDIKRIVESKKIPSQLKEKAKNVGELHSEFLMYLETTDSQVYGWTTLLGHLDKINYTKKDTFEFNKKTINSHLIGGPPYYSKTESKYIATAKYLQLISGGTILSKNIISSLENYITSDEFIAIPKHASYSSGDVIPGTHLLWGIAKKEIKNISQGDVISFINGNFIQAGLSETLKQKLDKSLKKSLIIILQFYNILKIPVGSLYPFSYEDSKEEDSYFRVLYNVIRENKVSNTQQPVSIRCTYSIISILIDELNEYSKLINKTLSTPSGNPLIFRNEHGFDIISQGSFMEFKLSDQLCNIIRSFVRLLAIIKASVKLINSQDVCDTYSISHDSFEGCNIQKQKLIHYKIDIAKKAAESLIFLSNSSTSEGVEDLYNMGLEQINEALRLIDVFNEVNYLTETILDDFYRTTGKGLKTDFFEIIKN